MVLVGFGMIWRVDQPRRSGVRSRSRCFGGCSVRAIRIKFPGVNVRCGKAKLCIVPYAKVGIVDELIVKMSADQVYQRGV